MRVLRVALILAAFLVASFTNVLTLLMGVSRVANDPPGVESGVWAAVFVAGVGLAGALLVFFRSYAAAVALGLAAALTVTVIPPENGVPAALYAAGAALALVAYFVGVKASGTAGASPGRTGT